MPKTTILAGNKLKISSEKYNISTKQSHKEDELGGIIIPKITSNFYMTDINGTIHGGKVPAIHTSYR